MSARQEVCQGIRISPGRGKISEFCRQLEKNNHDKWALKIIQEGLHLQFKSLPTDRGTRTTIIVDSKKQQFISEEVQSLLEKNAIEPVPSDQIGQGFYSTFFLVPKKDGGFRPILNLRVLNTYLDVPHFKMETLRNIVRAIDPRDWALSLDLKDAYLHMCPAHLKFLRFFGRVSITNLRQCHSGWS